MEFNQEDMINIWCYLGLTQESLFNELKEEYATYRKDCLEQDMFPEYAYKWVMDRVKFTRK